MLAPLDCSNSDGIGHEPRFEARLYREEPTDLAKHSHSLTPERWNGGFEPFKS
jgi:hypothetical protein